MNRLLLLLLGLLLLSSHATRASHVQGGELTYQALGNNRYRLNFYYVRDCASIAAEPSMTGSCRVGSPTTSCTSTDARNFTFTMTRGLISGGTPYCSSTGNLCSPNGLFNYERVTYTADVTLPPAPEWTLSVELNYRPSSRNIGGNSDLRYEATLNNQITLPNGSAAVLQNTAPQFYDQDSPVPFVCWQQRTTLGASTFEPDGDSLVYTLDRPLEGCNQFSSYAAVLGLGSVIPTPGNTPANPCYAVLPAQPGMYSASYPIASFQTAGTCPVQSATPFFKSSRTSGYFTFAPAQYFTTPPANGDNKYAVVMQVTEYRRVNGRYYKIGSVRREMLVIVNDCGGNQIPSAPVASVVTSAPGLSVLNGDSVQVNVPAGVYTELDLPLHDPNPADLLTVTLTQPSEPIYSDLYPNAQTPILRPLELLNNGTAAPVVKMRFQPAPIPFGRLFRIPIRIEDNACPLKGTQNLVLIINVGPTNTATATQAAAKRTMLSAYPTPFTEQVRFTLPRSKAGAAAVLIFDQLGRLVDQLPVPASATPAATLTWTPAATVPTGVYSARFADGTHTARLVRVAP